jgi:hypothetical protein
MRTFYTHDNGGRPFQLKIDSANKKIICNRASFDDDYGDRDYDSHVITMKYKKYFVGRDANYPGFDGSSVLVQRTERKYVYFGWKIYEFELEQGEKMKKFTSEVGNSDVIYAYAVSDRYVYLFVEEVKIPIEDVESFFYDIYGQYYNHSNNPEYKKLKQHAKKIRCRTIQKRL